MHDAANFFVAANHRIKLAAASLLGQITGIALERLILGFGILIGDLLGSADCRQCLQNGVMGGAVARQDFLRGVAFGLRDRQQQVFGRDVLVLEVVGFLEGALEKLIGSLGDRGLRHAAARDLGQGFNRPVHLVQHRLRSDTDFFQYRRHNAFFVFEHRG